MIGAGAGELLTNMQRLERWGVENLHTRTLASIISDLAAHEWQRCTSIVFFGGIHAGMVRDAVAIVVVAHRPATL
jgi:hypothetical protein